MKTAWSHLPNATHIDRVLASLKAHPEAWAAAGAAARDHALTAAWAAVWYAARDEAWEAAWAAVWYAARDAAWVAAWAAAKDAAGAAWAAVWYAARDAARDEAWVVAWNAAGGAVLALVAYDNSAKFLDMTPDELKMWWALSEDPACILLLPAVRAFEQIAELELA